MKALKTIKRFSSVPHQAIKLPDLNYDYGELQPVLSPKLLEFHHKKHHQTYVTNFNNLMEQNNDAVAKNDFNKVISLQQGLKFNYGGYLHHKIYWENLAPASKEGGVEPSANSSLHKDIQSSWGSFENFKDLFIKKTIAIQGSGWGWLVYNPEIKSLQYLETANQDPITNTGTIPLLTIDVWEHAYYIDYQNLRADYTKKIWEIINWKEVEARYNQARK